MENKPIENFSDVSAYIKDILNRLSKVEHELEMLKSGEPLEMPAIDITEAIDLSLETEALVSLAEEVIEPDAEDVIVIDDDLPMTDEVITIGEDIMAIEEDLPALEEDMPDSNDDMPVVEEDLPVVEESSKEAIEESDKKVAEDLPAETAEEEPFTSLFGEEFIEQNERKPRRGRKPSSIINDKPKDKGTTVMDILADKKAWLHDMPGPEVKSLRSAIALGDQVLFIRRLFRDDSALYQDSIDKLNSMPNLEKAIDYLNGTFPEWDMDGEDVYRFMMAVRRKIRK